MSWLAESLHCVVFYPPGEGRPDALQPWISIFGEPPQNYQSNTAGMPPGGNASGQIGDYQLTIVAMPGRMELILGPVSVNGPPDPISNLDQAAQIALTYFEKMAAMHAVVRAAFVANLSKQFASSVEAVSAFKKDTGLDHLPNSATDLSFAINVRKKLNSAETEINRLARWGTGVRQLLTLEMMVGGVSPKTKIEESQVETLQIDINTVLTGREIAENNVLEVLKELISEFRIILDQGYSRLDAE